MLKTYRITNVDCANCAAKIERRIQKIKIVDSCTVNFLTQRITIGCENGLEDAALERAKEVAKKIEPECDIIER